MPCTKLKIAGIVILRIYLESTYKIGFETVTVIRFCKVLVLASGTLALQRSGFFFISILSFLIFQIQILSTGF